MLGNVDGLTVPYPREYLAGVMAQVPEAHCMRLRCHGSQCITILWPQTTRVRLRSRTNHPSFKTKGMWLRSFREYSALAR